MDWDGRATNQLPASGWARPGPTSGQTRWREPRRAAGVGLRCGHPWVDQKGEPLLLATMVGTPSGIIGLSSERGTWWYPFSLVLLRSSRNSTHSACKEEPCRQL